jgi:hypothetical protein
VDLSICSCTVRWLCCIGTLVQHESRSVNIGTLTGEVFYSFDTQPTTALSGRGTRPNPVDGSANSWPWHSVPHSGHHGSRICITFSLPYNTPYRARKEPENQSVRGPLSSSKMLFPARRARQAQREKTQASSLRIHAPMSSNSSGQTECGMLYSCHSTL